MLYSVTIQYDAIDKIYIAMVPELQGCAAHGPTAEAALHEVSIAADMWMEEARLLGKSIPDPVLYAHAV